MSSQSTANEISARREFLSRVGKAAVTAPAVALLVAASSQQVAAQYRLRDDDDERKRRRQR